MINVGSVISFASPCPTFSALLFRHLHKESEQKVHSDIVQSIKFPLKLWLLPWWTLWSEVWHLQQWGPQLGQGPMEGRRQWTFPAFWKWMDLPRAYSRLKIYQKPWLTTQKEGCKAQQRHVRSHCLEQSLLFHSWPGWPDFLSHLSSPPLPVRPSRLKISKVWSQVMMKDQLSLHNIREYLSNLV